MNRRSSEKRSSAGSPAGPRRVERGQPGTGRRAASEVRPDAVVRRIHELLEGTAARLAGLELVDVELIREGRRTIVRVLIDRDAPGVEPGRGGGITIEDCSRVSRMLGDYLDGDPEVAPLAEALGAYSLEVSSPGIDRPLKKPEHFARFRGQTAAVSTHDKILERVHHLGVIAEVTPESVVIDQPDLGRTEIRFSEIKKAHLKNDPWQVAREVLAQEAMAQKSPAHWPSSRRGSAPGASSPRAREDLEEDMGGGEASSPETQRTDAGRSAARRVAGGRGAGARDVRAREVGPADPGSDNPGARRGHRGGTES